MWCGRGGIEWFLLRGVGPGCAWVLSRWCEFSGDGVGFDVWCGVMMVGVVPAVWCDYYDGGVGPLELWFGSLRGGVGPKGMVCVLGR